MPGAGQMYQGRLRRGASIMLAFFGIITVAALTYVAQLNILLPVLWFYSFFDSINCMNMTVDELRELGDKPLFRFSDGNFDQIFKKRNVFAGWAVVFIGTIMLYNTILKPAARSLERLLDFPVTDVLEKIPALAVAAVIIAIGIKLIAGEKKGA